MWYVKNEQITAAELRVLDETGHQIGVIPKQQALDQAKDEEKDLVLIAKQATPPVAKIIDFRKFLYQEEKKKKEAKKGVKKSTSKDVQLSLFIAEGDLQRMVGRAQDFLTEGFQVRIKLVLKGRELGKRQMAFDLINEFIGMLKEAAVSTPPKMQGRVLIAVVVRKKKGETHEEQTENTEISGKTV